MQSNPHPPGSLARAAWIIAKLGSRDGYPRTKPGPITIHRGLAYFLSTAHPDGPQTHTARAYHRMVNVETGTSSCRAASRYEEKCNCNANLPPPRDLNRNNSVLLLKLSFCGRPMRGLAQLFLGPDAVMLFGPVYIHLA